MVSHDNNQIYYDSVPGDCDQEEDGDQVFAKPIDIHDKSQIEENRVYIQK